MKVSESQPVFSLELYEFGDFLLDTRKRLVRRRDGVSVALTPKVFDTLLYLVEHGGIVVDKHRLMEAVWPDAVVEENNLSQNISALRRALGETPDAHRYIVTVPGRGYRFVADVKTSAIQPKALGSGTKRTIAVLPFKPLVAEKREASLEMGMTDTLIARLSNIHEIIVSPLSAVRKYVDLDQKPICAGRELEAESVLEGYVEKANHRIRVTVRLLDVSTGSCLWSGIFDEKFTNIFDVQDAISERVVAALTLPVSTQERKQLTRRYTENVKAYDFYLMGRHCWNKVVPLEIQKSIGFFKQALELDPNYALAYEGLAGAYRSLAIASDARPKEAFRKAKAAAQRAIEIDEQLPLPHAYLAFIHFWFDWDWAAAEKEARRAIECDPHSAPAYLAYAHLLSDLGRHEEAIAAQARARELEPLSLIINAMEGQFFYHAGRDEEANACLLRTLELEPRFWIAHLVLGKIHLRQRRYAEAIACFKKARQFSGDNSEAISMIGYALAQSGHDAGARGLLGQLQASEKYVPPYNIAVIYNGLGETGNALDWLERACEHRDVRLSFLRVDPKWESTAHASPL